MLSQISRLKTPTALKLVFIKLYFLGNLIAFAPSLALIDYLFNELNVKELYSEVRRENTAAIRYNQQLGYQLADHPTNQALVSISLTHDDYFHATPKLKSFLNRG